MIDYKMTAFAKHQQDMALRMSSKIVSLIGLEFQRRIRDFIGD